LRANPEGPFILDVYAINLEFPNGFPHFFGVLVLLLGDRYFIVGDFG